VPFVCALRVAAANFAQVRRRGQRGIGFVACRTSAVRRWEQTNGAGGDGDLPGNERPHLELWRGGRDGHGPASRRQRNEGRRVGSVGGEERREEGVGSRRGATGVCIPG